MNCCLTMWSFMLLIQAYPQRPQKIYSCFPTSKKVCFHAPHLDWLYTISLPSFAPLDPTTCCHSNTIKHFPTLGAEISPTPSSPWKEGPTPSPLHASPSWQTLAAAVPRQCAWLCPRPHLQHWHRCLRWPAVAPSLHDPGWQPGAAVFGYGCSSGWHHSDPWREELHQRELLLLNLAEECCGCGACWGPKSQVHLRQDSRIEISKIAMWSSPLHLGHNGPHTSNTKKGRIGSQRPNQHTDNIFLVITWIWQLISLTQTNPETTPRTTF